MSLRSFLPKKLQKKVLSHSPLWHCFLWSHPRTWRASCHSATWGVVGGQRQTHLRAERERPRQVRPRSTPLADGTPTPAKANLLEGIWRVIRWLNMVSMSRSPNKIRRRAERIHYSFPHSPHLNIFLGNVSVEKFLLAQEVGQVGLELQKFEELCRLAQVADVRQGELQTLAAKDWTRVHEMDELAQSRATHEFSHRDDRLDGD